MFILSSFVIAEALFDASFFRKGFQCDQQAVPGSLHQIQGRQAFCVLLNANTEKADVDHCKLCWLDVEKGYELLQEYFGGIASVMTRTASVESDFSLINWTKDPHSKFNERFHVGIYVALQTTC